MQKPDAVMRELMNEDDRLIYDNVIDEKGQLKLYHAATQKTLLGLTGFKAALVSNIKDYLKKKEK